MGNMESTGHALALLPVIYTHVTRDSLCESGTNYVQIGAGYRLGWGTDRPGMGTPPTVPVQVDTNTIPCYTIIVPCCDTRLLLKPQFIWCAEINTHPYS